ncbi:DNA translocase FtsK [Paraferrimonas sedimenticola]|uniref:DNA translocase FtsK n=1 Tax=Paraferrimonas sedimenticola TaxID=375674 RepID=A0AA37VZW1_9GAMM|nr:DNA translocase FtsK 4TM domain-containing protein [Paraferrimonas sedimenticola]GLP97841.1 DNA translocase FtsK [Paraferrimonas sedimenticola]
MSQQQTKTLSGVQRLLEGGLIFCGLAATFVVIALASFDAADPAWSQTSLNEEIKNYAGSVGAWVADVLFYIMGFSAWVMPAIIIAVGLLIFRHPKHLAEVDYFAVGLRIIGFLLMLCGMTSLASMNANDIYYFSAGGVIGDVISSTMLPYFSQLGTTLILLWFVGAGFTLLTGVSWITLVESIGSWCIVAGLWLWSIPKHFSGDGQTDEPAANVDDAKAEEGTDDTSRFMSIVNRFRAKRDSEAQAQEQERREPTSDTTKRAEPVLASSLNDELEANRLEPNFGEKPAVDDLPQCAKDDALEDELDNKFSDGGDAPWPSDDSADDGKAKIVDGQVVLPKASAKPAMPPLPDISLLDVPNRTENPISQEELDQVARLVEAKLLDFNITAQVVDVCPGPVITRFELDLAPGIKVSKITGLAKDLARALSAVSVRVVEVIPGKSVIGLELPNKFRETVFMRDVLDTKAFEDSKSNLTMVLGADIGGQPVVVDLGKMPHLLVAGTTGSGKSVGVNTMIVSLLYKSGPEDVRLILIDPKMLELSVYEGIPHLLCEVVTDMKQASNALRWCVGEMERRYKLMSALGVRNLKGYNAKIAEAEAKGEAIMDPLWNPTESMAVQPTKLEKMPSIVVVVDEFADMMMIVGKKVEELIARIAQKARAAGIHLILATQRPSVDVITGLIKANVPTRMAFQVSSKIDSRTILDQQGAETLLGMGDMLYLPPGTGVPVRVHGAFVDDHEVHRVVADWKQRAEPDYLEEILAGTSEGEQVLMPGEAAETDEDTDPLYDEAVMFVTESRRGSISSVQRKFKIGYNRAARIIEQMEGAGVVSTPSHNGNREVLAPPPVKVD